jgi:hypothetical protein
MPSSAPAKSVVTRLPARYPSSTAPGIDAPAGAASATATAKTHGERRGNRRWARRDERRVTAAGFAAGPRDSPRKGRGGRTGQPARGRPIEHRTGDSAGLRPACAAGSAGSRTTSTRAGPASCRRAPLESLPAAHYRASWRFPDPILHRLRVAVQSVDTRPRGATPSLLSILRSRQQGEILTAVLGAPDDEVSLASLAERLRLPYPSVH